MTMSDDGKYEGTAAVEIKRMADEAREQKEAERKTELKNECKDHNEERRTILEDFCKHYGELQQAELKDKVERWKIGRDKQQVELKDVSGDQHEERPASLEDFCNHYGELQQAELKEKFERWKIGRDKLQAELKGVSGDQHEERPASLEDFCNHYGELQQAELKEKFERWKIGRDKLQAELKGASGDQHEERLANLEDFCKHYGELQQAELKEKFERWKARGTESYGGLNLYVKHLDKNIDDEKLRVLFSPFGTITSARVMTDGGRSKGFGFVCFSEPEDAMTALGEMNGRFYVAIAQRKEARSAQLAARREGRNDRRLGDPTPRMPSQNRRLRPGLCASGDYWPKWVEQSPSDESSDSSPE